jgi:hypothetical protein
MPGGILNDARSQNINRLLKKGDDKFVKLDKNNKLKIGYTTKSAEVKFQNLSDTPRKSKTPELEQQGKHWVEKKDENGETVYGYKLSDKAQEISDTANALLEQLKEPIKGKIASSIADLAGKHNLRGEELAFGEKTREAKNEIYAEIRVELTRVLLGGDENKISGMERITVAQVKRAAGAADRLIEAQVEQRFGGSIKSLGKYKRLNDSPATTDKQKKLFNAGRRDDARVRHKADRVQSQSANVSDDKTSSTATTASNMSVSDVENLTETAPHDEARSGSSSTSLPEVGVETKTPSDSSVD